MGRTPCCSGDHAALKRGPWTNEEDQKLIDFLLHQPSTSWRSLPQRAGLLRCGKSCRLRWMNYLRPDIRRGNFTEEEENRIIQLHAEVGNKWSIIACHLPGRTDNEIKNLWNTKLRKLLVTMGLNPITHQPLCDPLLADYVKQWIKSIENMLIVGLATSSSSSSLNPNTTSNNRNSNSTDTPPWMTLPPMQPATASDENFQHQSPNILNSCPGPSMMNSTGSFVVDVNSRSSENFSDSLMFGEGSFLPGDLSYLLKEDFGESTELVGNVDSQLASAAPAALEEGFMYWD